MIQIYLKYPTLSMISNPIYKINIVTCVPTINNALISNSYVYGVSNLVSISNP